MSMLEKFFYVKYAGRSDLFEGLSVWEEPEFRELQGSYPVVFLSFAGIKDSTFAEARKSICRIIEEQYNKNDYLLRDDLLNEKEKEFYQEVKSNMQNNVAVSALRSLADFLGRFYRKKTIILLDEYDTPLQEAFVNGYWDEMTGFIRNLFNYTFKTNPYLERAIMTGITRVRKESIFSDLNHLKVVTTTSGEYADCFGFTEEEAAALCASQSNLSLQEIAEWYNGYLADDGRKLYNPRSVILALINGKCRSYWTKTGKLDEVLFFLKYNIGDVRDDVIKSDAKPDSLLNNTSNLCLCRVDL